MRTGVQRLQLAATPWSSVAVRTQAIEFVGHDRARPDAPARVRGPPGNVRYADVREPAIGELRPVVALRAARLSDEQSQSGYFLVGEDVLGTSPISRRHRIYIS